MKFLRVLCAVCALLLPAFSLDREAFTFTKYDLNVQIEPEQQRLGVRGKIILRNDSAAPQKNLPLQISSSLSWRSITEDGNPVQFLTQPYTSDVDHTGSLSEAIVTLAHDCPPKGEVELEVGYEGTIPLDATRLTQIGVPADAAKHSDWDRMSPAFTAVRGVGYVAWYPVATEAASLSESDNVQQTIGRWKAREAQSSMRANFCYASDADQSAKFVADGAEASDASSSHCSNYVFENLARTVPTFALANFSTLEGNAVRVEYLPASKSAAADYVAAAGKVTPFIAGWFGTPSQKAEVVELADPEAAPFEAGSMLLTPLNHLGAAMELMAVHQLTHAAFFSPRPWIYEGLAYFAQALYLEHQDGRQAALDFMESHRALVVDTEKSLAKQKANSTPEQSLVNTEIEDLYRSKAMYVWWMLRDMVSEPVLKRALAAYKPDQDKVPQYFQRLLEAESKRDLQWFFDDWIYHDKGLPDFRVASIFPQQTPSGSYLVTVTIENLGGAGAEVPVTVRAQGGESTQRLEVRAKSKNSMRFTVPSAPLEVVVNDGSVPESDMSNNILQASRVRHTVREQQSTAKKGSALRIADLHAAD
jgi:hypothetical protein